MEDIRIGVFICHCGTNIGGFLDVPSLVEYAKTLPNVTFATDNLYSCSEVGLSLIKEKIEEHDLNRIVVASCTPRTHEPLFRSTCQEAGLNPYLFEMVNIRDQCSWVHMKETEAATEKAKILIEMGVAKALLLQPLKKFKIDINPTALIIGGGIAGMTAALNLANQEFKVILIEKEPELGGLLKYLYKLYPTHDDASKVLEVRNLVENHKKIKVITSTEPVKIEGFIGNYKVSVKRRDGIYDIDTGIIIVATGAQVFKPKGLFGYNGSTIITQLELEQLLKENKINVKNIVMIQCVGARNEERRYCSNICCMTALKNAMLIKELKPDANITIIFRDIQTQGTTYEEYYRKAREKGITFIRYIPEKVPIVKESNIEVYNDYLNQDISILYDMIVLSTPLIANPDSENLAKMLKVPLEENHFFLEAHVKLRPVDFATDGIYVCGSAHWPADIPEAISQAYAAASRASTIISKDVLEVEGAIAEVDEDLCVGCGICIKICPYNAISKDENGIVHVTEASCKGCGLCGATCPENAITSHHFTTKQILAQILASGGK
ncbi:Ion-translocating oxidoreductase complex subunit B [subsurface metagenome]